MLEESFAPFLAAASERIVRARVVAIDTDGSVRVAKADLDASEIVCDRLYTGPEPVTLDPGDAVICLVDSQERGVVLGRIGRLQTATEHSDPRQPSPPTNESTTETPDVLVLEASRELTLKAGDGLITLRADGKILIKGADLVSHARRTNRIKGGSVSIN